MIIITDTIQQIITAIAIPTTQLTSIPVLASVLSSKSVRFTVAFGADVAVVVVVVSDVVVVVVVSDVVVVVVVDVNVVVELVPVLVEIV
jgi:hypothetical protein